MLRVAGPDEVSGKVSDVIYVFSHGERAFRSQTSCFAFPRMAGTFAYLFPQAPSLPDEATTVGRLDALAAAMVAPEQPDTGRADRQNSANPAILTCFGQFIDHDISAVADGDPAGAASDIAGTSPAPLDRSQVLHRVRNLRRGRLGLDSVYGDEAEAATFDSSIEALLRHPREPAKMLVGRTDHACETIAPPLDGAADLARLGRFIDAGLSEGELRAGADERCRGLFFHRPRGAASGAAQPNRSRAVIADARNDTNLFIAQFHLAWLRLHNRIVDGCRDAGIVAAGGGALHRWARERTRLVYQWLVVHAFLRALCDESVLTAIARDGPLLYDALLDRCDAPDGVLPLPLEFSSAAFRFGHSMVRARYDWNRVFPQAGLHLLFSFTGGASPPMLGVGGDRLPASWPADWSRLALTDPRHPDRCARRIGTDLSFPLGDLPGETAAPCVRGCPNLAQANLRRGYHHAIGTAQACLDELDALLGVRTPRLSEADLTSGTAGAALRDNGFAKTTPLWFYILKEAEIAGDGNRLGPLGTHIVAGTLIGLLAADTASAWNRPGSGSDGRFHPRDIGPVSGVTIDSLPAMLRAALVM